MRIPTTILSMILALGLAACGGKSDEDGGGAAPAGPVGTWVADRDVLAEEATAHMKQATGLEELPAEALQKIEAMKAQANVTAVLAADGTFTATGNMGPNKIDETGSWKLQGDDIVFTWATKDGQPYERTDTAPYDGDSFRILPNDKVPFRLRMIRKSGS